ncbi:hypothetical protein Calkro_2492 [Caldicellulosiruptor kronotskyensis 2002]|uniref:Uncharacterized protein n=1 Tax=Caldicellulosiruptor kronotskyensis (strain DSM 18902 / VKM B-2412 / 2002) TaxID=632348 RepID=E4SHS7_CALK2|nr:hypothetical protein [Caldicellulosiruptor kronotskyensis]ADQ47302.1 hypothetical protein Calkro_2492 [Caldicellulosiruptor kronotskyensis 2002]
MEIDTATNGVVNGSAGAWSVCFLFWKLRELEEYLLKNWIKKKRLLLEIC